MDILAKLHEVANKRQMVWFGLELDSSEGIRAKAQIAFDDVTMILHDIATHIHSEHEKGRCKTKGCPHYALGEENGCTIYTDLKLCADS